MRALFLLTASLFVVPPIDLHSANSAHASVAEEEQVPPLDQTYLAWREKLASPRRAEQQAALHSMLPTKADIEYLFPAHAGRLWPIFDEGTKYLLANAEKMGREFAGDDTITKVTPIDIRQEEAKKPGQFKKLLEILPRDVLVYRIVVERPQKTSGSSTYLYFNRHWVWIRGAEGIPDLLAQKP